MDNLLYLSYGQGPHVDQLVYAVLSALDMLGRESSSYRIIVYTDNPVVLGDLPVHIETLDSKRLDDWAGPFGFNHRRKIFAIKEALQKFGGRLVYCDADTYFLKHPHKIFARIRPGHTVMHIREGHFGYCHGSEIADFLEEHDLRMIAGQRWNITPNTLMFNAGVVGLREADIPLLDEVAHLTDQIYPHVPIHTIEQFAFSACFRQYTKLHQSYDVIYHYWPGRAAFCEHLSRVLHDPAHTSNEERWCRLLPYRPCQSQKRLNRGPESLRHRIHMVLWQMAKRAGVLNLLKHVTNKSLNPLKKIAARASLKN